MERYRLPGNVTGLTMRDGTKLDANRRGIVEVPERYRRDASDAMKDTGLLSSQDTTFRAKSEGHDCAACGFGLWKWQDDCPRCGSNQKAIALLEYVTPRAAERLGIAFGEGIPEGREEEFRAAVDELTAEWLELQGDGA